MPSRGFIGPVGGNIRLRWARPGYDARDMTLSANKLAFDSSYNGALNLVGQFVYTPPYISGNQDTNMLLEFPTVSTKLISWPDLGYIPLVILYFGGRNTPADPSQGSWGSAWQNWPRLHSHFNRGWSPYISVFREGEAARTQYFESIAKRDGLYVRRVNCTAELVFIRAVVFAVPT